MTAIFPLVFDEIDLQRKIEQKRAAPISQWHMTTTVYEAFACLWYVGFPTGESFHKLTLDWAWDEAISSILSKTSTSPKLSPNCTRHVETTTHTTHTDLLVKTAGISLEFAQFNQFRTCKSYENVQNSQVAIQPVTLFQLSTRLLLPFLSVTAVHLTLPNPDLSGALRKSKPLSLTNKLVAINIK